MCGQFNHRALKGRENLSQLWSEGDSTVEEGSERGSIAGFEEGEKGL